MNARQTKIEFNRQIRALLLRSTSEEREQLRKYIKPMPLLPVRYKCSEPERIGDILPGVMVKIKQRCKMKINEKKTLHI